MTENNRIDIRVILKGKTAVEFILLINYYGLENRTDFIRYLIHEKYEELKFKIKEDQESRISQL